MLGLLSPPRALLRTSLLVLAVAWPVHAATQVTDPAGRPVQPFAHGGPATVLVFTAVDCPISDRYAPEVRRLAAKYAAQGIRFWIVYANQGERADAAKGHAEAFGYGLPVALDTGATLADRARVAVTPEAAVFDRAGRLVYHGRIDDRYTDFGVDRPSPTRRDLAVALEETLAGHAVSVPETRAIGCAIVRQP